MQQGIRSVGTAELKGQDKDPELFATYGRITVPHQPSQLLSGSTIRLPRNQQWLGRAMDGWEWRRGRVLRMTSD
jgi:hypothetical protein